MYSIKTCQKNTLMVVAYGNKTGFFFLENLFTNSYRFRLDVLTKFSRV